MLFVHTALYDSVAATTINIFIMYLAWFVSKSRLFAQKIEIIVNPRMNDYPSVIHSCFQYSPAATILML